MHYHIPKATWEAIYKYLCAQKGLHTGDEDRLRLFIEGIWYVLRTGCQWRLLPEFYGHWRCLHQRFLRWNAKGLWEGLFESTIDADLELVMIDATVVRSHACAAGYGKNSQYDQALGRSSGGFTTKINALVDALGNPLKFILSPGQKHDINCANSLLKGVQDTVVLADKAYDCQNFISFIEGQGSKANIPSKSNSINPRTYDTHMYKERHLIECFFGKVKNYRRLFSRFDKIASSYMAFLQFAATLIWLK